MKIEAQYYHKNYNAFEEVESKRGQAPYEITVEVPDTLADEEIRKGASKPSALKEGYNLKDLYKVEWNGVCWERNKI